MTIVSPKLTVRPSAVRQPSLVEDLDEDVEHARLGLLGLVEEQDRVRAGEDGVRQLAALLEPDVARIRSHEAPRAGGIAVFRHVERDERRLVAEQQPCQRLGQLGLADPRRTGEEEGRARAPLAPAALVLETDAVARHHEASADGIDDRVLAHHARAQPLAGIREQVRRRLVPRTAAPAEDEARGQPPRVVQRRQLAERGAP